MSFVDIEFPRKLAQGVQGGPAFNTLIVVTVSGVEQRIGQWNMPRYRWNVAQPQMTPTAMYTLKSFFTTVKGRLDSFRFWDWADYNDVDKTSNTHRGVTIDNTTGAATWSGTGTVQMYKNYVLGGVTSQRKITKPTSSIVYPQDTPITVYDNGTLMVLGTDYTIDLTMGVITPLTITTGHTITWRGSFNVHARFDVDEMRFTQEASTVHSWGEIPVLEIRD